MREIKFRAWNKRDGDWVNVNQLTDWDTCEMTACVGMGNERYPYQTMRIESDAVYELMQYTGLKDKNGKEIYENDILLTDDTYHDYEGGVAINSLPDGQFVTVTFKDGAFWVRDELLYEFAPHREVIGNIYENPELLETNS